MRQLNDPALMQHYINKYHLQDYFSFDLRSAAVLVRYEANEILGMSGRVVNTFSILVSGECIAYMITRSDKFHCECHYRDMHFMGMVGTLWNKPAINDIKALTPCLCLCFPAEIYRPILLNDVKFLRYAAEYMASHIRQNAAHFEPLETRLAAFILETEQDGVFRYNLTLCADLVETSYRHLLRTLHTFCAMGILKRKEKSSYLIADRSQLEELRMGHGIT